MFAAVDLGSNSFRLHVGAFEGQQLRIVKTARDPIRLAAGLDDESKLTEAAMKSAVQCLANFRKVLLEQPLDAVRVVATNTLRVARNAAEFLPRAEAAIGYPIEIISGEEEGRLIYMGVASTLPDPGEKRLVIDIGGGSTELILGKGRDIVHVESFSIGTFKQGASFFPDGRISAPSFEAAILSARSYFEDAATLYSPQHWTGAYGSSGTIRAINDVISKNGIGDGTMSYENLLALRDRLVSLGHVSQVDLAGIKQERVIVMVGGLAVLIGIMQELGMAGMRAINAGLRVGVIWDLQLREMKQDRRELSVKECMRRFHADPDRARRAVQSAQALYAQLKPSSDAFGRYLQWSGMLHEIGLCVSHTGFHKHSAYLVENADLPGFTTREQKLMSQLILGQKGNLRKIAGTLSESDLAKAVLSLRFGTMLMHAKLDAEVSELRLRMKNKIEVEFRKSWIARHPTFVYWLEKEASWWDEIGIDMLIRSN
ncbi:Ppx/GppA phosphatase family protein [Noviherbaspirillum galbum]|uniref:Ppx/GppA family phosphatase n=1 Tax=Noviherbaspirillum galbum TaxID=2709383 RepID=A0A6B3SWV7_9BURK|nr:Ppx/GppA phosphatase family protein [Noviherbaspirillum galbum]NEX62229.1 Ppx/GppA family phosphatase [Noviherbaspirillum galbum]